MPLPSPHCQFQENDTETSPHNDTHVIEKCAFPWYSPIPISGPWTTGLCLIASRSGNDVIG